MLNKHFTECPWRNSAMRDCTGWEEEKRAIHAASSGETAPCEIALVGRCRRWKRDMPYMQHLPLERKNKLDSFLPVTVQ